MRLSYWMLGVMLLAGCASHAAVPVASSGAVVNPLHPDTGVELRHMYLFAPGKSPVLIVQRDDAPSTPQEISSEPPRVR